MSHHQKLLLAKILVQHVPLSESIGATTVAPVAPPATVHGTRYAFLRSLGSLSVYFLLLPYIKTCGMCQSVSIWLRYTNMRGSRAFHQGWWYLNGFLCYYCCCLFCCCCFLIGVLFIVLSTTIYWGPAFLRKHFPITYTKLKSAQMKFCCRADNDTWHWMLAG